jgi:ubiquinone/menaquinone biosynthesis C-methylase UbiE
MSEPITSANYDKDVRNQGLEYQVGVYYEPKKSEDALRIDVVINALDPKSGESVLDLGCGVGTYAFHAARRGASCVGLDYSEESIRAARLLTQRYPVSGKTSFLVGNALELPFGDKAFDKVVCADFIEHITDAEKEVVLDEVRRVLKPGGRCVVFTPNKRREDLADKVWTLRHVLFKDKIPFNELHYGLITRESYERLLRRHGFSFTFMHVDVTRPILVRIPFFNRLLSLNLLWVISVKS